MLSYLHPSERAAATDFPQSQGPFPTLLVVMVLLWSCVTHTATASKDTSKSRRSLIPATMEYFVACDLRGEDNPSLLRKSGHSCPWEL
jgi:hypothetical protein